MRNVMPVLQVGVMNIAMLVEICKKVILVVCQVPGRRWGVYQQIQRAL